jgi:hypothetical protein
MLICFEKEAPASLLLRATRAALCTPRRRPPPVLSPHLTVACTGGPKARLAWAGARARRLWALKAKYNFTGEEGTGEGARGTRTSACYLDFVRCPGLSNFLGPPLVA